LKGEKAMSDVLMGALLSIFVGMVVIVNVCTFEYFAWMIAGGTSIYGMAIEALAHMIAFAIGFYLLCVKYKR
jgi:hypothetical protein